jgi:SAM-dependent methyltransferase
MPSLTDFTQDWNKYNLNVNTDRGTLTVKWNDANNLALWSNIQAGLYLQQTNSLQTFYEYFPRWYQMFWDARAKQGLFDIPNDSVILDVGCGVAVIDLLLAQYLPNSKFYLLDKEGFEFYPGVYYDANYPEYNSWEPVHDAINATELDPKRFTLMNPESAWPEQVDVITSYLSYCWHYPKDTYWDKVLATLKVGGKLILDVRTLSDRDIVGEITEDMKSEPIAHWFDIKLPAHIDNMPAPKEGMPIGGRFVWTRST